MKMMIYLVILPVILFLIAGVLLSLSSREGAPPGLLLGHLHPCPPTPNCVCSDQPETADSFVEPLRFADEPQSAWMRMQNVVTGAGGRISRLEEHYLAATFKTPFFRFVDDVELRLDGTAGVIHIRSASRVGRSDLGMNRKRVARLRSLFAGQGE